MIAESWLVDGRSQVTKLGRKVAERLSTVCMCVHQTAWEISG